MVNLEHPKITRINSLGYLDNTFVDDVCEYCNAPIRDGQSVIDFKDNLFCDKDCLIEAFCESPFKFGAEKVKV